MKIKNITFNAISFFVNTAAVLVLWLVFDVSLWASILIIFLVTLRLEVKR